jgi:hypothetical protein
MANNRVAVAAALAVVVFAVVVFGVTTRRRQVMRPTPAAPNNPPPTPAATNKPPRTPAAPNQPPRTPAAPKPPRTPAAPNKPPRTPAAPKPPTPAAPKPAAPKKPAVKPAPVKPMYAPVPKNNAPVPKPAAAVPTAPTAQTVAAMTRYVNLQYKYGPYQLGSLLSKEPEQVKYDRQVATEVARRDALALWAKMSAAQRTAATDAVYPAYVRLSPPVQVKAGLPPPRKPAPPSIFGDLLDKIKPNNTALTPAEAAAKNASNKAEHAKKFGELLANDIQKPIPLDGNPAFPRIQRGCYINQILIAATLGLSKGWICNPDKPKNRASRWLVATCTLAPGATKIRCAYPPDPDL